MPWICLKFYQFIGHCESISHLEMHFFSVFNEVLCAIKISARQGMVSTSRPHWT